MSGSPPCRAARRACTWIVLWLLCLAGPARAQGTLQKVLSRRALRVGMSPGVVPFVAAGPDAADLQRLLGARAPATVRALDGRAVCGFDVELAVEAARYLGVRLDIVLVEAVTDLLPGLREGRYDVVASAMTRTLERALYVSFSDPYFASGLQVLVRDPGAFPMLDSLKKPALRIGFLQGTTAESYARSHLKEAQPVRLADEAALFAGMGPGGKLDAVVVDYVTARDAEVRERLKTPLRPVEERRFTTEHFAFALRQNDGDWLRWLNLFLFEVRSSGAFHRLAARYNPWFRSER